MNQRSFLWVISEEEIEDYEKPPETISNTINHRSSNTFALNNTIIADNGCHDDNRESDIQDNVNVCHQVIILTKEVIPGRIRKNLTYRKKPLHLTRKQKANLFALHFSRRKPQVGAVKRCTQRYTYHKFAKKKASLKVVLHDKQCFSDPIGFCFIRSLHDDLSFIRNDNPYHQPKYEMGTQSKDSIFASSYLNAHLKHRPSTHFVQKEKSAEEMFKISSNAYEWLISVFHKKNPPKDQIFLRTEPNADIVSFENEETYSTENTFSNRNAAFQSQIKQAPFYRNMLDTLFDSSWKILYDENYHLSLSLESPFISIKTDLQKHLTIYLPHRNNIIYSKVHQCQFLLLNYHFQTENYKHILQQLGHKSNQNHARCDNCCASCILHVDVKTFSTVDNDCLQLLQAYQANISPKSSKEEELLENKQYSISCHRLHRNNHCLNRYHFHHHHRCQLPHQKCRQPISHGVPTPLSPPPPTSFKTESSIDNILKQSSSFSISRIPLEYGLQNGKKDKKSPKFNHINNSCRTTKSINEFNRSYSKCSVFNVLFCLLGLYLLTSSTVSAQGISGE